MNYFDQLVAGIPPTAIAADNAQRNRKGGGGRPPSKKTDAQEALLIQAGARMRERREELGFSIGHMAICLDVEVPCYRQWENRFGNLAQTKQLENVAAILKVAPEWISGKTDEPPTAPAPRMPYVRGAPRQFLEKLSVDERRGLAQRARARRKALKLTPGALAKLIDLPEVTPKTIRSLESYIPVNPNSDLESRWEGALQVPAGWLRDESIEAMAASDVKLQHSLVIEGATCVADEMRGIFRWLSRKNFATRTAKLERLDEKDIRAADIFGTRYGLKGEQASTLQGIADDIGVSRQRIEQIVLPIKERAQTLVASTPFIDRLVEELRPLLPQTVVNLDRHLRELLGESLSLAGVERFAQDVLKRSILTITESPSNMQVPWELVAVDPNTHDPQVLRVIRDAAMAMVRNVGAAQVDFIAGVCAGALDQRITPTKVIEVINMIPGFEWLQERDGWFWLGEKYDNRLLNVAKKVLAVAGRRVDIEDIHGAMARARRIKYESSSVSPFAVEAPYAVLVSALTKTSWVELIQYDDFRLLEPIPLESILSMVELAVYQFLVGRGGLAARYDIQKALLEVDAPAFTPIALHAALDSSPIFYRLDTGIFALRAAALSSHALKVSEEAVGGPSYNGRYSTEATPTADGFLAIKFEVMPYMLNSSYFEAPKRLADILEEGDYQLGDTKDLVTYAEAPDGRRRILKFTRHLESAGFEIGEVAVLQVNPTTRLMRLEKDLEN